MPSPIYPEPERLYPVEQSAVHSPDSHELAMRRRLRRQHEIAAHAAASVLMRQLTEAQRDDHSWLREQTRREADTAARAAARRLSFEQRITERDRAVAQWFSDQARALNAQRNDVVEENSRIDHFSTREEANAAYLAGCEQVCVKPRYYYSSGANKVRLNSTNRHAQWVRKAVDVGLCDAGKEPPIGDGEFLEPQSPSPPVTNIEA